MKVTRFNFYKSAILSLLTLLVSCSSTNNIETSYYLLNTGIKEDSSRLVVEQNKMKTVILLELKELPEYLSQRYLVMQLDDHRLHYAQFHLWAEPLSNGIEKALLKDLNSTSEQFTFILEGQRNDEKLSSKLHVQIEHFFANNQSSVTLSGKYWFDDKTIKGIKPFYYNKALSQNGYPHSVATMRGLLIQLSEEILR